MTQAPRRRGKEAERQVAKRLKGKRILALGIKAPDIEGDWFVGEVKSYLKAPEVPFRELKRLKTLAAKEKLCLFVYKRPGWHDFVVCCLLSDFEDWYGKIR